jgi:starch phosphorylase
LLYEDPFVVLADYQAYADCQEQVSAFWRDQRAWTRTAILNVAGKACEGAIPERRRANA